MRKYIAILFLTIYALNTTDLIQFMKLPVLVSHFFEHLHDHEGHEEHNHHHHDLADNEEHNHYHNLAHDEDHHNEENTNVFIDFIVLHYGKDDSHTKSDHQDRDKQLPFKSHDSCCNQFQLLSFISPISCQFNTNIYFIKVSLFTTDKDFFIPSQFSCNIWQPPKA